MITKNQIGSVLRITYISIFLVFLSSTLFADQSEWRKVVIKIGDWTLNTGFCTLEYSSWGKELKIYFGTKVDGSGDPEYDISFDAPFLQRSLGGEGVAWVWVISGKERQPFYYSYDNGRPGYHILSGIEPNREVWDERAIPLSKKDALRFLQAISGSDNISIIHPRGWEILSFEIEGSIEAIKSFDVCMKF